MLLLDRFNIFSYLNLYKLLISLIFIGNTEHKISYLIDDGNYYVCYFIISHIMVRIYNLHDSQFNLYST